VVIGIRWTVERLEDARLTLVGQNADGSPATEICRRAKP
jgi:hypothetical protein